MTAFLSDAEEIEYRPLPRTARGALYLLLLMIAVAVAWASLSEVDRLVVAGGKLVTTASTIVMQPMETSILRGVMAQAGQRVKAGDALAILDSTFASADLVSMRRQIGSLSAQVNRIEAELAGPLSGYSPAGDDSEERVQVAVFQERNEARLSRLALYDERISRAKAALGTNLQDHDILRQRVQSLAKIEDMYDQLLEKNIGSKLKALEKHDQRLAIDRELRQAINRAEELRWEISAVQAEKDDYSRDWRQKTVEELVSARRRRDELADQLAKAELRYKLVTLTTPANAIVLDVVRKSVGSVIKEAEPVVTLVPLDSPLEVEVRIPAADIGYVRQGDPVRIKIDAFPFQRHGTLEGRLRTISADAFSNEQQAIMAGQPQAYYQARVSLGSMTLKHLPSDTRLTPGMTGQSEIVVGKRSVISYFFYPVFRLFDESIREP
ncbi:MAG: HlyD family type I secretion periplasmic adaptor subunit [Alphaproteobacteria bacterium]|nr:HlyD family type I secretion periplasmic adaptor subunit [Alphaproteobacteria bacterium]